MIMEQAELRIEIFLYQTYGPLISSKNIWHVLCYPSLAAYQQARLRGDLPVNEFSIEGRRGYFVFTEDVICWLKSKREEVMRI